MGPLWARIIQMSSKKCICVRTHNPLVLGSNPSGPTNVSSDFADSQFSCCGGVAFLLATIQYTMRDGLAHKTPGAGLHPSKSNSSFHLKRGSNTLKNNLT